MEEEEEEEEDGGFNLKIAEGMLAKNSSLISSEEISDRSFQLISALGTPLPNQAQTPPQSALSS